MIAQSLKVSNSYRIRSMTKKDVAALLKDLPSWPEKLMKPLRELPVHLHMQSRRILCDSPKGEWQSTGLDFPQGTVFQIYDPTGSASYNDGGDATNAYGENIRTGACVAAGESFKLWQCNAWGTYFGKKDTVFYRDTRTGYGAGVMKSKDQFWTVREANWAGLQSTIYNDDYYEDNYGAISATIEWWPPQSFFEFVAPMLKEEVS